MRIQIADFDQIKQIEEQKQNTKYVSTLYYRAPELFFGYQ